MIYIAKTSSKCRDLNLNCSSISNNGSFINFLCKTFKQLVNFLCIFMHRLHPIPIHYLSRQVKLMKHRSRTINFNRRVPRSNLIITARRRIPDQEKMSFNEPYNNADMVYCHQELAKYRSCGRRYDTGRYC